MQNLLTLQDKEMGCTGVTGESIETGGAIVKDLYTGFECVCTYLCAATAVAVSKDSTRYIDAAAGATTNLLEEERDILSMCGACCVWCIEVYSSVFLCL